ncbi:MAG TPA: hypothetical protein VK163_10365 [Opitutaceae bacterium]|nr:hypothetical protein [Opitutaceae bacterium]
MSTAKSGAPGSAVSATTSPQPPAAASATASSLAHGWLLLLLFAAALAAHVFALSRNWDSGFLVGHEFRQAQTALIADHIDRQDNFSLRYDTPLFGKPWGAPLEWPLYEWMVVLVRRQMSWPDFVAARAVSATFFYLMLPAVYLLLGEAGLTRAQRWPALALILSCPVYVFYSRAYLMESTVLCFSVWFLLAFVKTLRTRRLHWAALTSLLGAAAGMMKSLTFGAWVAPAALFGAWTLVHEWRQTRSPRALLATVGWGCGAMVVPIVLTVWWTHFADSIKAQNPATAFLTSKALGVSNYGTFTLAARLSGETWQGLFDGWRQAIMAPWLLAACSILGFSVAGRHRVPLAIGLALFFVPQLAIPYAYALQDYYFYAATVFLLIALGFGLVGLMERPWPAWIRALLLAAPFAALWTTYLQPGGYWSMQRVWTNGRTGLTEALRDLTPEDSVLVIVGADWNASIAYQSRRRALMITASREQDLDFIEERIAALDGEQIGAVIFAGRARGNRGLARFVTGLAGLSEQPTFSHGIGDVYFSRELDTQVRRDIAQWGNDYSNLALVAASSEADRAAPAIVELTPEQAAGEFPNVHPAPVRYAAQFGLPLRSTASGVVLAAHPDARLWVPGPPEARTIVWDYGLDITGSPHPDGVTDGVVFRITGRAPDGTERQLFRETLRPVKHPEDRGLQHREIVYTSVAGETLCFETLPRADHAYDWAYWARIEVR